MNQSIVALIRPGLNLAQKENHASHLIEHFLIAPKRLKKMGVSDDFYAKNIITHSGETNSFYMTEYYVCNRDAVNDLKEILKNHQGELCLEQDDFEKIKSATIEELNENRGEFISTGEQLSRAIYSTGSPTIRNLWNNTKSILKITPEEVEKIFYKHNTNLCLLNLSFDTFELDNLPIIEKDKLRKTPKKIELIHPWQSPDNVDVTHIVPYWDKPDFLIDMLYRRSLTDARFGLIFNKLHHEKGLIYEISIHADYGDNTSEITFSSSEKNINKVIDIIKQTLKNYDQFIEKNITYIKDRLKLDLALDWGNIQNFVIWNIDRVILGKWAESPRTLIERIDQITEKKLVEYNNFFSNSLDSYAITVIRRYGKTVSTK